MVVTPEPLASGILTTGINESLDSYCNSDMWDNYLWKNFESSITGYMRIVTLNTNGDVVGIGRHAGLRSQWAQARESSSLSFPTI